MSDMQQRLRRTDRMEMERRTFLRLSTGAIMLGVGGALTGCGGGGSSDGGSTGNDTTRVTAYSSTEAVATDNGEAVTPLANIENLEGHSLFFWGVKDQSLLPSRLVQAMITTRNNPSQAGRIVFDRQSLPETVVAQGSGDFMTLTWNTPERVTFQFYSADGTPQGGSIVNGNGDTYTINPLPAGSRAVPPPAPSFPVLSTSSKSSSRQAVLSPDYGQQVSQKIISLTDNSTASKPWFQKLMLDIYQEASANPSIVGPLLTQLSGRTRSRVLPAIGIYIAIAIAFGFAYVYLPSLLQWLNKQLSIPTADAAERPFNNSNPLNLVLKEITTSANASIVVGQTVTISAVGKNSLGNTVSTSFTWSSSNPSVASVDGAGNVLGKKEGSTTITVTDTKSGKTKDITVTVGAMIGNQKGTLTASWSVSRTAPTGWAGARTLTMTDLVLIPTTNQSGEITYRADQGSYSYTGTLNTSGVVREEKGSGSGSVSLTINPQTNAFTLSFSFFHDWKNITADTGSIIGSGAFTENHVVTGNATVQEGGINLSGQKMRAGVTTEMLIRCCL